MLLLQEDHVSPKQAPPNFRHSQILLMQRVPVIKGTVVSYSLEGEQLVFKILAFKDTYTMWSEKKTYAQFKELDRSLEAKYAREIRKGIFRKARLPSRDEFNVGTVQGLELFKNHLKVYLESMSNEPNSKINSTGPKQVNTFLPRELLEFLKFDSKLIEEILDFQD